MVREFRDKDHGYKEVMAGAHALKLARVIKVGILTDEPKRGDSRYTLIEVALVHEFGLGDCPERSFIRAWVDENETAIKDKLRHIGQQILLGKLDADQGYNQFGAWAAAQIKKRIRDGIEPPLAPETIERKGSSVPLVNTGQLVGSITWQVAA